MKDNDFQDIKLLVRLRGVGEGKPPIQPTEESIDSKQSKQANAKGPKQNTPNQSKPNEKKDAKKPSKTNPQQSEKSNFIVFYISSHYSALFFQERVLKVI